MLDIRQWMDCYFQKMWGVFGDRIVFVGLQGSRGRGEAREDSDIDVVFLLDHVTAADLDAYHDAAADLPERSLLCGFVSGKEELAAWDRADLFQFYYDTVPYFGGLDFLRPLIGPADIRRAVHQGACDLYHACCHNYLHERDAETLRACFKSACFILQAKYYLETGAYISSREELLHRLSGADREILNILLDGNLIGTFSQHSALLLEWSSRLIRTSL